VDVVILMGDPRVAEVPVIDCGEPLLTAGPEFRRSSLKEDHEPYRSRLRSRVLERLGVAQQALPSGLRLCWVEGHRRFPLQEQYFQEYRQQLTDADPALDPEASYQLASRYVSPPAIAPHVSGAAIDLTLCTEDGAELDLGTPVNASPEDSDGACYFSAPVSPTARQNRGILAAALGAAGLVNYPTEWWHWSYGDRYWALHTGHTHALYGPVLDDAARLAGA
jgi:D-alanyl-D-alanine dipeptidase